MTLCNSGWWPGYGTEGRLGRGCGCPSCGFNSFPFLSSNSQTFSLAVGRWWDGNRRLGRGRDAQSLSTVVPLGPPWNQPLPPRICLRTHGTELLEKSADIFETYLRLCIMVSINQEALSKQENQRHVMNHQLEFLSEEANTDFTRQ